MCYLLPTDYAFSLNYDVLVVVHVTLLCLIALFTSSKHMKYGRLHHNKTKPLFVITAV